MENFFLGGIAGLLCELRRWIILFEKNRNHDGSLDLTFGLLTSLEVIYSVAVIIGGALLGGWAFPELRNVKEGISAFLVGACPTFFINLAPIILGRLLAVNVREISKPPRSSQYRIPLQIKEASGSPSIDDVRTLASSGALRPTFFGALFWQ